MNTTFDGNRILLNAKEIEIGFPIDAVCHVRKRLFVLVRPYPGVCFPCNLFCVDEETLKVVWSIDPSAHVLPPGRKPDSSDLIVAIQYENDSEELVCFSWLGLVVIIDVNDFSVKRREGKQFGF